MMRIEDDDLTLLIARTWSAGDHVQHDQSPNGEKAVESGDARASHCPLTLMVFFRAPRFGIGAALMSPPTPPKGPRTDGLDRQHGFIRPTVPPFSQTAF